MGAIPRTSNPQANRRLDSWKDIAAFFGRDKSTVRRWETERGLPVHRVPGLGRGSVYAFTDELQQWLGKPESSQDDVLQFRPAASVDSTWRRPRLAWLLAGTLVLAIGLAAYSYRNLHFGAKAAGQPQSRHIPTPEAQDFYLKGQFYWSQRTPESLNRAVDSFTQAVVHDPAYAQAYVGLAESYNLLREFSVMPATEAYPRALAAERKAVELDDASSEAHADLAFTILYWKWDWPGAEREFKRAIALDPNNAHAHHWYATALLAFRRAPEALAQIDRAQKLDPASMAILADKGLILYYAGEQDSAIELLRQMETAEPSFAAPHRYLAEIYGKGRDFADSLRERDKMDVLLRDEADLAVTNAAEHGLASGGTQGMLASALTVEEKIYPQGNLSPYGIAQACAQLGREDDSLRYLHDAYERRDLDFLVHLQGDHAFDRLRGQPEFQELQARLNVPRPD